MSQTSQHGTRLVADVGGTNARLALYDPATNELRARKDYLTSDYAEFQGVVSAWLNDLQEDSPTRACIAVAAPLFGDQVTMLNINWSFSCREIAAQFSFEEFRCINDFEGNAYSLSHLTPKDVFTLRAGEPGRSGKLAAMGPGTGLGGATFGLVAGRPVASACEPGHMGLAPATALELDLFAQLMPQYGEIHAELLVSGPGLLILYQTLGKLLDEPTEKLTPPDISSRAMDQSCTLCEQTLELFCALLGSTCGDFVLAHGAYGGMYLTGGILPSIIPFLQASSFQHRFDNKGGMQDYLAAVPVHVITSGRAGLVGASHAPI